MPGDDFRSCRLLFRKPILSAITPGQRRGGERSPSPGGERYQLPREAGRQVGARQSRVVRAKQSALTGERSPGGRLDAGATGAQVPKQETLTGADVGIRPPAALTPELTGADVGIRPPAALTPELTGADVGIQPPADPGLSSPKTPK